MSDELPVLKYLGSLFGNLDLSIWLIFYWCHINYSCQRWYWTSRSFVPCFFSFTTVSFTEGIEPYPFFINHLSCGLSMCTPLSARHQRCVCCCSVTWKIFTHLFLKALSTFDLNGLADSVKGMQRPWSLLQYMDRAGIWTQVSSSGVCVTEWKNRFVNFSLAACSAIPSAWKGYRMVVTCIRSHNLEKINQFLTRRILTVSKYSLLWLVP